MSDIRDEGDAQPTQPTQPYPPAEPTQPYPPRPPLPPQPAGQPYPQPGQPQQPYPPQQYPGQPYGGGPYPGQPVQAPYPGQPGVLTPQQFAATPAPPYPGYAAGAPGAPGGTRKRGPWLILGIVGGGLLLLVIIGVIFGVVASQAGRQTAPAPTVQPSEPADPGTTDPDDPDAPAAGDPIAFHDVCAVAPVAGWTESSRDDGYLMLTNDSGELAEFGCTPVEAGADPALVVSSWFDFVAQEDCTQAEVVDTPAAMDLDIEGLAVASGVMACTISDAQGTFQVGLLTIGAVRDDGLASVSTLYFFEESDLETLQSEFSAMVPTVWESMLR